MHRLPVLSGEELIKILKKAGFSIVRQKGSHVSLQKENLKTVVPRFGVGTHRNIKARNSPRNT
ncbi:MAG: type II toxin-antitoxin system HicA family toxin [Deltaproteobacteria bacterium]|nr:type II toxin-antitoxin system HicA family toxin [Deltaproteobacteria bacterium]